MVSSDCPIHRVESRKRLSLAGHTSRSFSRGIALQESLAIVGMACRLPGADGLDAFWDLVLQGQTAWGPLPEARLSRELYFDPEKSKVGKSYSELGGIVSDRPVDQNVCPITP